MGRDDADQAAPHRERERGLQKARQVVVKSGLIDYRAPLLPAQIRRTRRQRDNLVPRRESNPVGKDVARFVGDRNFLDRARRLVEAPRPHRRRLDELERHVLVVPDVPAVHSAASRNRRAECAIGSLGPGEPDAARLLGDFHLRPIGDPSALIRQQNR